MQLIATSRLISVTVPGDDVSLLQDVYDKLASALRERLVNADAATYLSKPVFNANRDVVEWYTDLGGEVRRYTDLDDIELAEVAPRHKAVRRAIAELAAELRQSADDAEQFIGVGLEFALLHGDAFVYVVGDKFVLAEWGVTRDAPGSRPVKLFGNRIAQQQRAGAIAPQAVPGAAAGSAPARVVAAGAAAARVSRRKSRFDWVGWLLSVLLVALLPLLLFQCSPGGGDIGPLLTEEAKLRRELAELQEQMRGMQLACDDCSSGGVDWPDLPGFDLPDLPDLGLPGLGGMGGPPGGGMPEPPSMPPEELCDRTMQELGECDPGEASVTLAWDSLHDLDIGVETPSGRRIYHEARLGPGGGNLVLDYNWQPEDRIEQPIELITWPGGAMPGRYRVFVKLHDIDERQLDVDPIPFTVQINVGEFTETFGGSVAHREVGRWKLVYEFVVP